MGFFSDLGDVVVDGVGLAIDNEIRENSGEAREGRAENGNPFVNDGTPAGTNASGQPISFIQTSAGIATAFVVAMLVLVLAIIAFRSR